MNIKWFEIKVFTVCISNLIRSPVEIWVYPNSSTIFSHWVPFPEAGPPSTKMIFGFPISFFRSLVALSIYLSFDIFIKLQLFFKLLILKFWMNKLQN